MGCRGAWRRPDCWSTGHTVRRLGMGASPPDPGRLAGGCNGGAQRPPCQDGGTTPHILRLPLLPDSLCSLLGLMVQLGVF